MSKPDNPHVFDFDCALVREPAPTVINGLRSDPHAAPDLRGIYREHAAYVVALRTAGVEVEILPPLAAFPDSIFLEDPALVLSEAAILLRPGAPSRLGESAALAPYLKRRFDTVFELGEGVVDGGDVLVTSPEVMIALSGRTDRVGAEGLQQILRRLGRRARIVETPPGILHFKTAASLLDEETVLATNAMALSPNFRGVRVLTVPTGEDAAANTLRINDTVLVGADYPRTLEMIARHGLSVVPLPVTEIAKLDAGLSCMSLRWRKRYS